jgi:hypothetical protein
MVKVTDGKTILMRLQGVSDGTDTLEEDIGKAEEALNSIGIAVRKTPTEWRPAMDVLTEFAQKYKELGQQGKTVEQSYITEALAGKYRANILAGTLQNFDQIKKALEDQVGAMGSAERENARYMDSIQARTKALRATWEQFATNIINSDWVKNIVTGLQSLVTWIDKSNMVIPILAGIMGGVLFSAILSVKAGIDGLVVSFSALNLVSGGLPILIGAIVTGVTALGLSAYNASKSLDEYDKKLRDVNQSYKNVKQQSEDVQKSQEANLDVVSKLIPELEELANKENKTTEEKSKMQSIVDQLNKTMPDLALSIDKETGALNRQITSIYDAIEAYKKLARAKALEQISVEGQKKSIELETAQKKLTTTGGAEAQRFLEAQRKALASGIPLDHFLSDEDAKKFSTGYFADLQRESSVLQQEIDKQKVENDILAKEWADLQTQGNKTLDEINPDRNTVKTQPGYMPPKKETGSSGADYNEQYSKSYLKNVDAIDSKIQHLNNEYKRLQETNADILEQNKKLEEIAQTQVEKQQALNDARSQMQSKQEEVAANLSKYGINPNASEDEIGAAVSLVPKGDKRRQALEWLKDYQDLVKNIQQTENDYYTSASAKAKAYGDIKDNLIKLEEKNKKSIEETKKAQEDISKLIQKAVEDKLDAERTQLEATKDRLEDEVEAQYKKEKEIIENEKKTYDRIYDVKKNALQREKDLLQKNYDEKKYQDDLTEKQSELTTLQTSRNKLSRDNSGMTSKELLELDKKIADKRKEINEFIADHTIKTQENSLEEQIRLLDEEKDRKERIWDDETDALEKAYNDRDKIGTKYYNDQLAKAKSRLEQIKKDSESYAKIVSAKVNEILTSSQDGILLYLMSNLDEYKKAGQSQAEAYVNGYLETLNKAGVNGTTNPFKNTSSVAQSPGTTVFDNIQAIVSLKKAWQAAYERSDVNSMQTIEEAGKMHYSKLPEEYASRLRSMNYEQAQAWFNTLPRFATEGYIGNIGKNPIPALLDSNEFILKDTTLANILQGNFASILPKINLPNIPQIQPAMGGMGNVTIGDIILQVDKIDSNTNIPNLIKSVKAEVLKEFKGINNVTVQKY